MQALVEKPGAFGVFEDCSLDTLDLELLLSLLEGFFVDDRRLLAVIDLSGVVNFADIEYIFDHVLDLCHAVFLLTVGLAGAHGPPTRS